MAFELVMPHPEAERIAKAFDTARFVPVAADASLMNTDDEETRWDGREVFYLGPNTQMQQIPRFKAVVNNTTNQVANIVSWKYGLVQHDMAARLVMQALLNTGLGESARYEVIDHGNMVRVRARFPDVTVKDGSRGGLHLGVQFGNNYAQMNSFSGHMLAWRQICSNGAIFSRIIPGTTFSITHVAGRVNEDGMRDRIEGFVENIAGAVAKVSDLVEATRATEVSFKNTREVELTIAEIVDRVKAPAPIVDQVRLVTNAYDVFNAVTHWVSHAPGLSTTKQELVLQRAATRLVGVDEVRIITPADLGQTELREVTEV